MGITSGLVQLWDVSAHKQVRALTGHRNRVGSLAWNNHLLSSGGRYGVQRFNNNNNKLQARKIDRCYIC